MSRSRSKNVTEGMKWGIISQVVTTILPFISRTVMLYTLGAEYLGLGGIFNSILKVLNLTDLGIGSAITYNLYKPLSDNNKEEVCALLNLFRRCLLVAGTIVMIAGLILLPNIKNFISGDIPNDLNVYILFIIYLLNTGCSYFTVAHKRTLLEAAQRVDITNIVSLVVTSLQYILQIVVLLISQNYYLYVTIMLISTVINNLCLGIVSKKIFPEYSAKGKVDKAIYPDIIRRVKGVFVQKISYTIVNSADTIVISSFLGLRLLGIYQNYHFIITILCSFVAIIMSSLTPSVGNSLVTASKEKNLQQFKIFDCMYSWIIIWFTVCLVCLCQPFIQVWVHEENMLPNIFAVLVGLDFYIMKHNDMVTIYKQASGIWWEGRWITLIAAIINLGLNIVLVKVVGLSGILIATAFSLLFVDQLFNSRYLFTVGFQMPLEYIVHIKKKAIMLLEAVICVAVTYKICVLIPFDGLYAFILRAPVCIIIPNILLSIFNCKNDDFKRGVKFVTSIIKKSFGKGV